MIQRILLFSVLPLLALVNAHGQSVITNQFQMFNNGYIMLVSPEPLSSNTTLLLPKTGGTLVSTNGAGVSQAWLLGGNDLAGPGPSDNRIGSTTAHDVRLIAGGGANTRLTLLNSVNAVEVNGGELRFVESGGSEYSAFKAGSQTASYTYTLPETVPVESDMLIAKAVSGNNVTLGWRPGTNAVATKTTAVQGTTSDAFIDADNMAVTMQPNTAYTFRCYIRINRSAAGSSSEITFDTPTGTDMWYSLQRLDSSFSYAAELSSGYTQTSNIELWPKTNSSVSTYLLEGYVVTAATGGSLQLRFRRKGGSSTINLRDDSYLIITAN